MVTIRFRLLLLVAALSLGLPAGAQLHRGARTVVRGGLLEKPDSLKGRRDSLRLAGLVRQIDSIAAAEYAADSAAPPGPPPRAPPPPPPPPLPPRPLRKPLPRLPSLRKRSTRPLPMRLPS